MQSLFEDGQPARVRWLDRAENPWNVPVLDVRPVTLQFTSFSKDLHCAKNLNSFSQEDGTCFANVPPKVQRRTETNLRYRIDRILADGVLFVPSQMEHKWALFCSGNNIIFVRSWTRQVHVVAELNIDGDWTQVVWLTGAFLEEAGPSDFDGRVLDFLVRTHALGLDFPAPLPSGMERDPEASAQWCMSVFGKLAHFATPHLISVPAPNRPLRSASLLHIAAVRGDRDRAESLIAGGLPVDLFDQDGMTPMHWAFLRNEPDMIEFLRNKGLSVDARSSEGATPLMNAVQSHDLHRVRSCLRHGADPNAADLRGFTSLHRAAELGDQQIVQELLNRGARKDVAAHGHTPASLAQEKGNTAISKLLDL